MKPVLVLTCCLLMLFAASPGWTVSTLQDEGRLKLAIETLAKARSNIINNHQESVRTSAPENSQDFYLFLAYLDGRIQHYCRTLEALSGPQSLSGLPCSQSSPGQQIGIEQITIPAATGSSQQENVAALDEQFQNAMGTFDDMLLKEQDTIARTQQKKHEQGGSPQSVSTAGDQDPQESAAGSGQSPNSNNRSGQTQQTSGAGAYPPVYGKTAQGAGAGRTQQQTRPPIYGSTDLSKHDDDIVAKQLREAAEQETDPEIKARLWEEYRAYKESVR